MFKFPNIAPDEGASCGSLTAVFSKTAHTLTISKWGSVGADGVKHFQSEQTINLDAVAASDALYGVFRHAIDFIEERRAEHGQTTEAAERNT